MKLTGRLASRKLWATVITDAIVLLLGILGVLDPKTLAVVLTVIQAVYVGSQAHVDAKAVTPAGPMPSFAELDKLLDEARAKGWTLHRTIDEGIARGIPLKE